MGPGARLRSGPKSGRGAAARGGAKGGPRQGQQRRRTRALGPGDALASTTRGPRSATATGTRTSRTSSCPRPSRAPSRRASGCRRSSRAPAYGSRRACEELIEQARVEVNGEIVVEQGLRVDPEHDEIKVDGLTVATQSYQFFSLNKPAGVVSTMEDTEGRQCLGDYVTNRETRLFHVGRLDTETEGVILLTNHGELAHRLTHPKYGVKKVYLAHIVGPIPRDLGKQLKDGIQLEDGYARADHFRVVEQTGKNYLVEVTLHEGRKHIVRRMLAEAGFPVDKLVRVVLRADHPGRPEVGLAAASVQHRGRHADAGSRSVDARSVRCSRRAPFADGRSRSFPGSAVFVSPEGPTKRSWPPWRLPSAPPAFMALPGRLRGR